MFKGDIFGTEIQGTVQLMRSNFHAFWATTSDCYEQVTTDQCRS